ncbi:MAG: hypothetical protein M3Y46_06370 [Actinomycetota bacterium]|nr:hypothetical protein [Actinomycetota bacterium]
MNRTSPVFLDAATLDLLAVAYRARPRTVAELAELLDPDAATRLPSALRALRDAGFVRLDGDRLEFESVYAAFIGASRDRISRLEADTAQTVAMMEALPHLIRNWDLGEAEADAGHPLAARLVHGREHHWETWRRHLVEHAPDRPSWVLPDLRALREDFPWVAADVAGSDAGRRARVIVRPSDLEDAANHELVAVSAALGAEVRVLDDLPGWFYVDASLLAGLPVTWGESWPTTMVLIETPPVIAALNLVFDELWRRAVPAVAVEHGWEPVIRLLAQGLTDEAVARYLGLDVRTVRRRVADAMEALGASSRFMLGAAWARRQ